MRLLYLDIDGVLNRCQKHTNGYLGMVIECVGHLNRVLREVPDAQVVVTSAWRYMVHNDMGTVGGLELMLLSHGLEVQDRVYGVTGTDETAIEGAHQLHQPAAEWWEWLRIHAPQVRSKQVLDHLDKYKPLGMPGFAVVDDMALDVPRFVQTRGQVGLTAEHASRLIELLRQDIEPGQPYYQERGL